MTAERNPITSPKQGRGVTESIRRVGNRLALSPQWSVRAVRFLVAEQYLGGFLIAGAVAVLSALATVVAVSGTSLLAALAAAAAGVEQFFYSGTAADIATWLVLAAGAWLAWAGGYCR